MWIDYFLCEFNRCTCEKKNILCSIYSLERYYEYKMIVIGWRLCSQRIGSVKRQPIPLSDIYLFKVHCTVHDIEDKSSCYEVIDSVSDLLTDFPVGSRLHWMREEMRVWLEAPCQGTHHRTKPTQNRSANTRTATSR